MPTTEFCVYNQTRASFLTPRVTVIDAQSEPLKAVKALIEGLAPGADAGLWLVLLTPALALLPASLVDRGPSGTPRVTLFPAAVVALDPFVWESFENSLAMATVVTGVSLVLGVALARARLEAHAVDATRAIAGASLGPGTMSLSSCAPIMTSSGARAY